MLYDRRHATSAAVRIFLFRRGGKKTRPPNGKEMITGALVAGAAAVGAATIGAVANRRRRDPCETPAPAGQPPVRTVEAAAPRAAAPREEFDRAYAERLLLQNREPHRPYRLVGIVAGADRAFQLYRRKRNRGRDQWEYYVTDRYGVRIHLNHRDTDPKPYYEDGDTISIPGYAEPFTVQLQDDCVFCDL